MSSRTPSIRTRAHGSLPRGELAHCFELQTASGARAVVSEYGASVVELQVPDRSGRPGHVALGFATLADYLGEHPFVGATVGRYANRIARARYRLDGRTVRLSPNDGEHQLHGGPAGLHRRLFHGEAAIDAGAPAVRLVTTSPDGDQGHPGTLRAAVCFRLHDDSDGATTLEIDFGARSDAPTMVSFAHHGYFHLGDGGRTPIDAHALQVHAARYLPLDADGIPCGEPRAVAGTDLDFRRPRALGAAIAARGHGYDDCFMLHDGVLPRGQLRAAATLRHPRSGRTLEVLTDQPAMQLYTGESLGDGLRGHDGVRYGRRAGLCLETQHAPDAPNRPGLPSARLDPGEHYRARVCYRFGLQ